MCQKSCDQARGSFTRQFPLAAGDRVEARFAPSGSVTAECR
jgi:hypothetical protein